LAGGPRIAGVFRVPARLAAAPDGGASSSRSVRHEEPDMTPAALARAAALAALLCLPLSSHAIFRAYLASTGSDANPCTLQQPCRLLPRALSVVDEGGEIWMMDSANYNTTTVEIGK